MIDFKTFAENQIPPQSTNTAYNKRTLALRYCIENLRKGIDSITKAHGLLHMSDKLPEIDAATTNLGNTILELSEVVKSLQQVHDKGI